MRIICPTCVSHYEVEADQIADTGQLVRCAECRDVWLVQPRDTAQRLDRALLAERPGARPDGRSDDASRRGLAIAGDLSREPIDFEQARARLRARHGQVEPTRSRGRTLGGLAAAVMLAGAVTATMGWRTTIVTHVPQSASLFRAIGLPVNPQGLALEDVRSTLEAEGDKTVLTLQGKIANLRDRSTPVPNLTVVVRAADQTPLYTWTAPVPKDRLAKGESIEFHTRLAAPPQSGQDVRVSFANAAGVSAIPAR